MGNRVSTGYYDKTYEERVALDLIVTQDTALWRALDSLPSGLQRSSDWTSTEYDKVKHSQMTYDEKIQYYAESKNWYDTYDQAWTANRYSRESVRGWEYRWAQAEFYAEKGYYKEPAKQAAIKAEYETKLSDAETAFSIANGTLNQKLVTFSQDDATFLGSSPLLNPKNAVDGSTETFFGSKQKVDDSAIVWKAKYLDGPFTVDSVRIKTPPVFSDATKLDDKGTVKFGDEVCGKLPTDIEENKWYRISCAGGKSFTGMDVQIEFGQTAWIPQIEVLKADVQDTAKITEIKTEIAKLEAEAAVKLAIATFDKSRSESWHEGTLWMDCSTKDGQMRRDVCDNCLYTCCCGHIRRISDMDVEDRAEEGGDGVDRNIMEVCGSESDFSGDLEWDDYKLTYDAVNPVESTRDLYFACIEGAKAIAATAASIFSAYMMQT